LVIQTQIDIGLGEPVSPGDHLCALYNRPAERDALVRSFVSSALQAGDKCVCVLDPPDAPEVERTITGVGDSGEVDLPTCRASRQLELVSAAETIFPDGRFCAADKIAYWKIAVAGVMNTGHYQNLRAIGEHSSFLADPYGAQEVIRFESELKWLLPLYPQVIMCMYDLSVVGGAFLVDLVSFHRKVLIQGALVDNPYFLPPDEWLRGLGAQDASAT